MNIQEAAKLALETDLYMTRNKEGHWEIIRIKPTNSSDCCVAYITDEYQNNEGKKIAPGKRWQPKAEDLIANDWIVTELNS